MKAEEEVLHSAYALALFEHGKEYNFLDKILGDFESAVAIFKTEKDFLKIVKDPRISLEEKEHLLNEMSKELKFSKDFANFMKLLLHKRRFGILHGIFLKFRDMYDAYKGRVKVFLSVSARLDKDKVDKIKSDLNKILKKDIVMEEKLECELVGGVKIQFEGKIYDGSIKRGLEHIKEMMV